MLKAVSVVLVCALAGLGTSAPATADTPLRAFTGTVAGDMTVAPSGVQGCHATGADPAQRTASVARGAASHLGRVRMTSEYCSPPAAAIEGGDMTLVGDTGDQVHLRFQGGGPYPSGVSSPGAVPGTIVKMSLDFTVEGGTGRFADAAGGGEITAYATFPGGVGRSWPTTWIWDGKISY